MITSGRLKQTIAQALGDNTTVETVEVHLRNLREGGLIAKAKTGRGAAPMGPMDATRLLIAVAGSDLVKDSVKSVERFGGLKFDPLSITLHGGHKLRELMLPLIDLPDDHAFSDGLRRVIDLLACDDFFRDDVRNHFPWSGSSRPETSEYLFVRFYSPYSAATIHYGARRRYHIQLVYGSLPVRDPRVSWDLRNIESDGQLMTVRIVDKTALTLIAKAVGML